MNKILELKNQLKEINYEHIKNIASFSGHRPQKLPWGFNESDKRCIKTKKRVKKEILKAIKKGYRTFLCGMALGFDMICAEIVLDLKKKYTDIKLIGAIPCLDQSKKWRKEQQDRYFNIINQLDGIRCMYENYIDGCMQERNRYMINNSSLLIVLYNGTGGGTKNTIEYAQKQGKEIIIIKPDD